MIKRVNSTKIILLWKVASRAVQFLFHSCGVVVLGKVGCLIPKLDTWYVREKQLV
jgi:hypothetical protein